MTTLIYGIKNCDTMKKAFTWLEANNIAYNFHDYKKQPAPKDVIERAIAAFGWNTVINTRGTTWRALPDAVKNDMDDARALTLALENPSIIKRPLLSHANTLHVGFDEARYKAIFA